MDDKLTSMIQAELEEENENLEPEKNAKKIEKKEEKNSEKKEEKKAEKSVFSVKDAENSDLEHLENSFENSEKKEEKISEPSAEENSELDEEEDEDWDEILEDLDLEDDSEEEYEDEDWEDEDEELGEHDEDPLADYGKQEEQTEEEEQKTTRIEDIKEKVGGSAKNTKNIEKLGLLAVERADVFKAKLCAKISGQHAADYVADDELKTALLEAIKEYLATQEFKEPTPFQTLMITLSMWTLPPFGMALWEKYVIKPEKEEKTSTPSTNTETVEIEVEGEQQEDYSHLKEYQDKRKIFTVTKDGFYNRTAKGAFIKVAIADEKPSPIIQEWLDFGYSSKQIREILNYGK